MKKGTKCALTLTGSILIGGEQGIMACQAYEEADSKVDKAFVVGGHLCTCAALGAAWALTIALLEQKFK